MSLTINSITSTVSPEVTFRESSFDSGYGISTGTSEILRVTPIRKINQYKPKQPKAKVLRRLKGFVVSLGEEEFRVAFVEDGEYHLYDLPASDLKKHGITAQNQPFEMDEITVDVQPYSGLVGYEFRPLAKARDVFLESLPIDDERQRKLELIKAKFLPKAAY